MAIESRTIAAFLAAPLWVIGYSVIAGVGLSLEGLGSPRVLLLAVVVYPVCEEIIFRAWVQGELSRIRFARSEYLGLSVANAVANLFFALTHFFIFMNLSALLVFFPGLVFGYFFDHRQNLILPVSLHAWYNLISLFLPPLW